MIDVVDRIVMHSQIPVTQETPGKKAPHVTSSEALVTSFLLLASSIRPGSTFGASCDDDSPSSTPPPSQRPAADQGHRLSIRPAHPSVEGVAHLQRTEPPGSEDPVVREKDGRG